VSARSGATSAALALLLAACASLLQPPPEPVSEEARRIATRLTRRWAQFSDLRTRADLTWRRGPTTQRLSGVLLTRAPDSVRFEALSPLGTPFLLLALAGARLTAWNVLEAQALAGPLNPETTGRWLGVPLEADELLGLLVGRVVPPRDLVAGVLLPSDLEGPSVRLEDRTRSFRIWLDPETGVVGKVEISGGRLTMTVAYDWGAGTELPTGVRATAKDMDLDAAIGYRSPALGTGVDPSRFRLALPDGVKVERFR
jgi:hypothetical protein